MYGYVETSALALWMSVYRMQKYVLASKCPSILVVSVSVKTTQAEIDGRRRTNTWKCKHWFWSMKKKDQLGNQNSWQKWPSAIARTMTGKVVAIPVFVLPEPSTHLPLTIETIDTRGDWKSSCIQLGSWAR